MSSSPSSSEEVLGKVRNHADYIKQGLWAEFNSLAKGFESGATQLTPAFLKTWESKWRKECKVLDDLAFTVSLDPRTKALAPKVEEIRGEVEELIQTALKSFSYYAVSPEAAAQVEPEKTMDEAERVREERRKRMAKFRGETP